MLSKLSEARRPIRPVTEDTVEFLELKDSMDSVGQLVPILAVDGEIVDGHRRFRAAKHLNWHDICTNMVDMDRCAILSAQIVLNDNLTIDERRRGIIRLSEEFGVDKLEFIAHTLNKHPDWVVDSMGLRGLTKVVRIAVDKGHVDVQSACLLAKLLPVEQRKLFGETLGLAPRDRIERLRKEVRHFYERKLDRRISKLNSSDTPIIRSERAVVKELFNPIEAMRILTACDAKTPRDGWNAALKWVLQIDPGSIKDRKQLESSE